MEIQRCKDEEVRHKSSCTSTEKSYRLEILDLEELYCSCSKNKSADQLRSYCDADLHLCFHICKMLVFK